MASLTTAISRVASLIVRAAALSIGTSASIHGEFHATRRSNTCFQLEKYTACKLHWLCRVAAESSRRNEQAMFDGYVYRVTLLQIEQGHDSWTPFFHQGGIQRQRFVRYAYLIVPLSEHHYG
jgi:hypothetical protein